MNRSDNLAKHVRLCPKAERKAREGILVPMFPDRKARGNKMSRDIPETIICGKTCRYRLPSEEYGARNEEDEPIFESEDELSCESEDELIFGKLPACTCTHRYHRCHFLRSFLLQKVAG
jgi:hypothetical protein